MSQYPERFVRGVPNKSFLDEENAPAAMLFHFGEKSLPLREDGFHEESINWMDSNGAIEVTLSQRKADGSIQFKAGAAIILREEFDRICKMQFVKERLTYERREIEGNSFHGNMLLNSDVPKSVMRKIAATIALSAVSAVVANHNA